MYRPSVFKKAGMAGYAKSPDEFIDMCKKFKGSGVFPYASMILPGNWTEGQYDLYIWVFGLGGNYAKRRQTDVELSRSHKGVTYLKKLFDAGYMPKETDKGTYRKDVRRRRGGYAHRRALDVRPFRVVGPRREGRFRHRESCHSRPRGWLRSSKGCR